MALMIIDFHTHAFPPSFRERRDALVGQDSGFAALYAAPRARLATAEELVRSMDEAGIQTSVALNFHWASLRLCQETNDYLLDAAARYPGRIVAFGAVPSANDDSLREVERLSLGGARGIGELRLDSSHLGPDSITTLKPLAQQAQEHRLILLLHASEPVGHAYPGKGLVTPGVLYRFVTAFPQALVVLAHWGGGLPFYALMPEVSQALANVYFDTAASPFLYQSRVYPLGLELAGVDKVLFGSDYPLMPVARPLKEMDILPPELRNKVLGENAQALLKQTGP